MWTYKYNNEANDGYHEWFDVVDNIGIVVSTPKAEFSDENNARLIVSLSHFHSVLRHLKDCYSTEFINWLEQHPHDWCLVTMVKNGIVFCRKCGKHIGTLDLYSRNIIHALELCRELALCDDCRGEE